MFSIVYFISEIFYNTISYNLIQHYNKLSFNDSINFLCIISSPIYTVFFLSILILYRYTYKYINFKFIFMFFLLHYYFDVYNYINSIQAVFKTSLLNLNLQNGLLNIHPYIIYIMYSWILLTINQNIYKQFCFLHTSANLTNVTPMGYLILIGIFLGAWWASQEFNWGGFWSWDPVELISLLVFLYILVNIHKPNKLFKKSNIIVYILGIITIYFIMRLGVVSTVHSFIKNLNIPFYAYIIFILILGGVLAKFIKYIKWYNLTPMLTFQNQSFNIIFIYFLMWSLYSILILLVYVNLNLWFIEYIPPLDYIYLTTLYIFLLLFLTKNNKYSLNLYCVGLCIILMLLNINYIYLVFTFCVFSNFNQKSKQILHFLFLWGYILFVCFFIQIPEFCNANSFNIKYNAVTDYYNNSNIIEHYESNLFFKKNYYLTNCKGYLQHLLTFNTNSSIIATHFTGTKNNQFYLLYSEEFTMFAIFFFIIYVLYVFRNLYSINVCYY